MTYTFLFMATCAVGAEGAAAPQPAPAPAQTVIVHEADSGHGCPGLLTRLRARLHRGGCGCIGGHAMPVEHVPAPAQTEPIKVEPAPKPKAKVEAPAPAPVTPVSVHSPYEIRRDYLPRVGNAEDHRWVTGQLFYIHADGGLWVVRYAPVDREDRYGGSMVLAESVSMRNFQEGDLVTVHGEILNEGRASKYLGGPLYRPSSVKLVERAAR